MPSDQTLIFGIFAILALMFTLRFVPETKGKCLEYSCKTHFIGGKPGRGDNRED